MKTLTFGMTEYLLLVLIWLGFFIITLLLLNRKDRKKQKQETEDPFYKELFGGEKQK